MYNGAPNNKLSTPSIGHSLVGFAKGPWLKVKG